MTPRKRDRRDQDKPKGVYRKRNRNGTGRWIYREYLGMVEGKATFGPDIYLCPLDAPMSKLWEAYEQQVTQESRGTLEWLLKQYHASKRFTELKPRTQADYADYMRLICGYKMKNGRLFGSAPLEAIGRTTIRGYRDNYGAPIAANRHIQYLKAAWNWCLEWHEWVPDNPCIGVKLNAQTHRETYVTDADYYAKMALCGPRSFLPLSMELAYLCRLRANEVYAIKREQIEERGLRVFRGKGSLGEITLWTPRLRACIEACKRWNAAAPTPIDGGYLLHDAKGRPYKMRNHSSQWQRLKAKADALGLADWTYHDLKHKGVTDQKKPDAGHMSPKMLAVYNQKGRPVMPADGEQDW